MKRRKFNKLLALGALAPLNGFNSPAAQNINDKVYNEAIVIDGLIIGRNWNEDS